VSRATLDVRGRVALITGGARGIGLDTARRLAARGARLALLDIDGAEAERAAATLPGGALALTVDVADRAAVTDAVADVVDRLGGIDVVVAGAGIEPPMATMLSVDPERFDRVLDVNLHGVWHTVKATLPHVVAQRGHVTVIASAAAFLNGAMSAPYAVSKAAVEQIGRALRTELLPLGTSAGVAYFGFIDTDMVRRAFADPAVQALRRSLPEWLTRPVEVGRAGEAIVRGIERRSAHVTAPGWVAPAMAMRGVIAGLDPLLARGRRLDGVVRTAAGQVGPPAAGAGASGTSD
jgi:NAD(P)-dependent dehydrogenase (short-subunit alcohol dehydrogenase family)